MPCYVTGSAEGDAQLDAQEARRELQRVTRVACELAKFARQLSDFWPSCSIETARWVREHVEIDRRPVRKESKKKREERELYEANKVRTQRFKTRG